MTIAEVRKFVTALVGAILGAFSLGLLDESYSKWVTVAIMFLTAVGVYTAPNSQNS